nr:hypothetical protein [Treponema socranskii]
MSAYRFFKKIKETSDSVSYAYRFADYMQPLDGILTINKKVETAEIEKTATSDRVPTQTAALAVYILCRENFPEKRTYATH